MPYMKRTEALIILGFNENDNPNKEAVNAAYVKKVNEANPDVILFPEGATHEQKEALIKAKEAAYQKAFIALATLYDKGDNPTDPNAPLHQAYAFALFAHDIQAKAHQALKGAWDLASKVNPKDYFAINFNQGDDGYYSVSMMGMFKDIEGLKEKLQAGIEYIEGPVLFSNIKIDIPTIPEALIKQYNTKDAENLLATLLKHPKLLVLEAPAWLFNAQQRGRLLEHMKRQQNENTAKKAEENTAKKAEENTAKKAEENTVKKEEENKANEAAQQKFQIEHLARQSQWMKLSALIGGTLGLIFTLMGASALTFALLLKASVLVLAAAILSMAIVTIMLVARELYCEEAEKTYDLQKLEKINDVSEISALQSGAKATNWRDYAKSYGHLPSYTHYKAYLGGYWHAMKNHEPQVTKIRVAQKVNNK